MTHPLKFDGSGGGRGMPCGCYRHAHERRAIKNAEWEARAKMERLYRPD